MSDRVSHHEWQIGPERWVVDSEFARKLEEEVGQLRERIEQLETLLAGERWISEDRKALGEVIRIVEAKP